MNKFASLNIFNSNYILKRIGGGSFGVIYKLSQIDSIEEFAVKFSLSSVNSTSQLQNEV